MADIDISVGELPQASTFDDESIFVVENQGQAQKVPGRMVKDLAAAGAEEAQKKAEEAAEKAAAAVVTPPTIGTNGNWYLWDFELGAYVDSGKSSVGSGAVQSVNGETGAVVLGASDVGALPSSTKIPAKTSDLTNDSGFITGYTETDPTVPAWAKASTKPSYSKSEVGLGNVENVKQYSASNPPPYPVSSVNGKTGAVSLSASDVGARPSSWTPTAANVGAVPTSRKVNGKALSADITLSAADVGAVPTSSIVQTTGDSTTAVMSQKAVTYEINKLSNEIADQIPEIVQELGADTAKVMSQKAVTDALATLGQVDVEFVSSKEEMTDQSKFYVMGGYVWTYMLTKTEVEVGGYTNQLENKLMLNYRISISGEPTLKTNNGTVSSATSSTAFHYIPVKGGDTIRVNRAINPHFDNGYARIAYLNSSKTKVAPSSDLTSSKAVKLSHKDGVTSWTVGYDASGAKMSAYDSIAYMVIGINVHNGTAVTAAEVADLVLTVNQPIEEGRTEVVETYDWVNTGHAFAPADYESRIITLENEVDALKNKSASQMTGNLSIAEVFAPSPQLPADGSEGSDFNGASISCDDIYAYMDALLPIYPRYITKETMGKDESGQYDWNRYILCRRYYDAWNKVNYPAMYAWVNGSSVIYSKSVSPRIGDTMYSVPYVGTTKGTVTAVSNANQTRTVGGVVYTRDKDKDVEPALVWTYADYHIHKRTTKPTTHNAVLDGSKVKIATIATHSDTAMTDSAGNSYVRYPLGDRNNEFVRPPAIIIGANEHGVNGDPPEPAIITARMAKDLCECKQADNPFLNLLKNEYMVITCPIINPYGFTHGPYTNSNDVNIDRNFDTPGWHVDTAAIGGSGDYGGSENETQYFMNTVFESKPIVATAQHCLGSGLDSATGEAANACVTAWMFGRNRAEYTEPLESIAEIMSANYNLVFQQLQATSEAPPSSYAKTRSYIEHCGVTGGAVEMQAREGFVLEGEGQLHTARILEADYTLLLQFLYMLIKSAG